MGRAIILIILVVIAAWMVGLTMKNLRAARRMGQPPEKRSASPMDEDN